MKLCTIASGSSGNCVYVASYKTNLLVDVGISTKRIEEGLSSIDIKPDTIQGILITHEHTDHISGLRVMSKRYNIPIYTTYETAQAILQKKTMKEIPEELFHYIKPNEEFKINDISVEPFAISHDASNPVGYTLGASGKKLGIATDLGTYDDYTVSKLQDSDVLVIEANHDENMLMVGKYPYFLKQRITGKKGHLSNDATASLLIQLLNDKLEHVILAHLSKENNYAELAYETVCCELNNYGCDLDSLNLSVAHRDVPSSMVLV